MCIDLFNPPTYQIDPVIPVTIKETFTERLSHLPRYLVIEWQNQRALHVNTSIYVLLLYKE